ncbi:extracellular solute-binding protein [Streptomyces thermodiastaticus]|uniref:extracellular solute-binding protein n=1 Tax=Streptomyces thermodiastaticus TaxID=44061 RepID=UPI001679EA86|nr:extracellular solute-binding protein [Streptomyces thermodiastaticus]MCE7550685.1 extracellular solute-binding protein [Streptomyces thermodiastaticus]
MDGRGGRIPVQRRTKGAIAAVSALGLAAVLSGCSGTGSADVTLRLVAADYGTSAADSTRTYWDRLVKDYESRHPDVHIEVSVQPWDQVDRTVRRMADAGDPPDLAQSTDYAGYAAEGLLYRADELLSIPVQADFLGPLSDAGQVQHVQYGIPFAASTRVLFYNKTLFRSAGLTPPTTWDELAHDAQVLKAQGVKYPYALPLGPQEARAEALQWMLGGGAGYTDDLGTYTLNSPRNADTFTWIRDELVGAGLTGPIPPARLDRSDAYAAFAAGDVGMVDAQPALVRQAERTGVTFGTVPVPGRNGTSKTPLGTTDWMMAFKKNGHKDEIGDFLDFVYSDNNVLDFSRTYDLLPVTASASDAMAASPQDKKLGPFLDQLPLAQLYPAGKPSWRTVGADVTRRIGQAVAPDGDPADVLDQLQSAAAEAEGATAG